MSDDVLEAKILGLLSDGRWRLLAGIAETFGVPRREVEAAVEALRLGGHAIVGGNPGVKLTDNPLELAAYVAERRRRGLSIAKGTRQLRRTLYRLQGRRAGQRTLFGDLA